MSKTVKRKVSVELQDKPSSKSRLSVFDRLGTKKSKLSDSKSLIDDFKQTLSAAVSISTKPILTKPDSAELEDADPDILEKKRLELQKELKMESRRAAALRKRKRAQSESSSSSYSSSGSSSSTSSSSSSDDDRHKSRKMKTKRRDSSSSSDDYAKKLAKKKRACQSKKEKLHKIARKHDMMTVSHKSHRRSSSPAAAKKHRSESATVMLSPSGKNVMVKNLKISTTVDKHHRLREKELDAMQREKERERERERLRMREEHMRSRSPKRRTPPPKRSEVPKPQRYSDEQERRDKDRELLREKAQALARSQERERERQRDRDRATKERNSRLLPRPAERAMALAAAQERRSAERDHVPTYAETRRPYASTHDSSFEHRKHAKEHDRSIGYESHSRREQSEFHNVSGSSYRRDWHEEPPAKEREWHEESAPKEIYERSTERHVAPRKEWSESSAKWESRKGTTWQPEPETNQWSGRYKEESWQESNPSPSSHHSRSIIDKSVEHSPSSSSIPKAGIGIRGRWNTWRGRGRGGHHTDFRRTHHHTEILEERGEIYRRHINPQGTNTPKPSPTPKPNDTPDKILEESAKPANVEENADEEIADDLSEISDEGDDILGQQEEIQTKQQPVAEIEEKTVEKETSATEALSTEAQVQSTPQADKSVTEETESAAPVEQPVVKIAEDADRSKDLCDDIDLDFEEISDGELEEEAGLRDSRIKGIGDALGVDWASLIEESKAMLQEKLLKRETSAKQQWNSNQILLDIGVSYKLAGNEFAQETLLNAFETLKTEAEQTVGIDTKTVTVDGNHFDVKVKIEKDLDSEPTETIMNGNHEVNREAKVESQLHLHPLPCVQRSAPNLTNKINRLVFNASGPYSRGLCTRRDIALRRQLCNLAIKESNCKINTNSKAGLGYENVALKLFQKAVQT